MSILRLADRLYGVSNDFYQREAWSPWESIDPALRPTHSGAPSPQGAVYEWSGGKDIGRGHMEIIELVAPYKAVLNTIS